MEQEKKQIAKETTLVVMQEVVNSYALLLYCIRVTQGVEKDVPDWVPDRIHTICEDLLWLNPENNTKECILNFIETWTAFILGQEKKVEIHAESDQKVITELLISVSESFYNMYCNTEVETEVENMVLSQTGECLTSYAEG